MNLTLMTAPILEKIILCSAMLIGGGMLIALIICLVYNYLTSKKGNL